MKNIILRFGIYGLILALVLFLIVLSFGEDLSSTSQVVIGYLTMTLSLCFIFFGIKHFRDHVNEGLVNFGQAFIIGMSIALLTSIGIAIADYLYTAIINPNFFEEYKAMLKADGFEGDIPEYSSATMAFLMCITVLCIGIIITTISSFLLRHK